MNIPVRKLFLAACLGASLWTLGSTPAKADDYWNRHWGWYDSTYRPYYYRREYYGTPYSYGYNSPYYYNSPYRGGYYYGPTYSNPGYAYPYRGGGVQLGPLQFGWW